MNKQKFKRTYRVARSTGRAATITHNGRRWTVSKLHIDRLDAHGCFDRIGQHAMALAHAADLRMTPGFAQSARVLIGMARELREAKQ